MTTSEEFDDPFLRHFQRDPLPDAGIRIILLTDLPADRADGGHRAAGRSASRDRPGGGKPHRPGPQGKGSAEALTIGLHGAGFRWCWSRPPKNH